VAKKMWSASLSALIMCLLAVGCGPASKVAEDAKGLEAFETANLHLRLSAGDDRDDATRIYKSCET
jgi:hypothetical protein